MTATAGNNGEDTVDIAIREALVDHCRLSADQLQAVDEAVRAMHIGFVEAAVHLGFVTPNEAQQAKDSGRTVRRRKAGLIETAIRRSQEGKALVPRPMEIVKPSSTLRLAHDINHIDNEQLRALRTQLLILCDTEIQGKSIAIVSPSEGEGRSQLAAELAISFSQLGRPTLLVDGDLRNPTQHMLFNASNEWGLSQALISNDTSRLYGVEGLPDLKLMTSGPQIPNALEMLSGGGFERLVNKWRHAYDFVVIDTPPAKKYSDGLAIVSVVRRAVVLCRNDFTYFRDAKELLSRLATAQSHVLGAVVNNF